MRKFLVALVPTFASAEAVAPPSIESAPAIVSAAVADASVASVPGADAVASSAPASEAVAPSVPASEAPSAPASEAVAVPAAQGSSIWILLSSIVALVVGFYLFLRRKV